MPSKPSSQSLGILVVLGSVWGLAEAGLGLTLQSCARLISGSVMTGVALFFIAAAWARTKRLFGPAVVVGVALMFKLLDAALLGLPLKHGAIANPMFAFLTEGLAFSLIVLFMAAMWRQKAAGRAFLGGLSALVAVNLFPLVKFASGIPACVYPGSTTPLSLYFAPIAVGASLITVPLGFLVATKIETLETTAGIAAGSPLRRWLVPSGTAAFCLAVQVLLRII
jgi:hypothetical protein